MYYYVKVLLEIIDQDCREDRETGAGSGRERDKRDQKSKSMLDQRDKMGHVRVTIPLFPEATMCLGGSWQELRSSYTKSITTELFKKQKLRQNNWFCCHK